MEFGGSSGIDVSSLLLTAAVSAAASLAVFIPCFIWLRREQRRLQSRILQAVSRSGRSVEDIVLTGKSALTSGELVAQFKVNHGKQVISVMESDGKRFIHIDGELSAPERAKMMRYLKSEGFMS